MTNKDLFEALRTFEKEKGIPMDYMLQNIEKAISVACKNYYGGNENVVFKVDPEKNSFDAKLVKTVVDEVLILTLRLLLRRLSRLTRERNLLSAMRLKFRLIPSTSVGHLFLLQEMLSVRAFVREKKVRPLSSFRASSVKLLQQPLKGSILSRVLQQSKSARAKLLCQRANSSVMTTLKKATTLRFTLQMSKTTKEVLTQSFQEHTPVL